MNNSNLLVEVIPNSIWCLNGGNTAKVNGMFGDVYSLKSNNRHRTIEGTSGDINLVSGYEILDIVETKDKVKPIKKDYAGHGYQWMWTSHKFITSKGSFSIHWFSVWSMGKYDEFYFTKEQEVSFEEAA